MCNFIRADEFDRPRTMGNGSSSFISRAPEDKVAINSINVDDAGFKTCSSVTLFLRSNHGDPMYIGLTSIQFLNLSGVINISEAIVEASPRDLNEIIGHSGDPRTPRKILDGVNDTSNDEHMWLAPFGKPENDVPHHWLSVKFAKPIYICGLKVYNYNKSVEDSYRGV